MIKSALSLENKKDNRYLTSVDKFNSDFAVEALANAGQRLGMKGDSVKYSEFTIKELLTSANKDYLVNSNVDYNCVIKYNQANEESKANATLCLVESGKEFDEAQVNNYVSLLDTSMNESINLFDDNYIAREFRFDKPINNIEYFVENSFITVTDNVFKTFLFGKKLGYKETDEFNIEILYNEFDLSNNSLLRAVRMYHLFSLANSNYYATIDIQRSYNNKDGDFILKVFILNDRTINLSEDQIDISELKKSFCLKYVKEQIDQAKKNKEVNGFRELYNKYINTNDSDTYFNYINEDSSIYKIIANKDILNTNTQPAKKIEDILNYDVVTHAILKQTDVLDASIIGENLSELSKKIAAYLSANGVEDDINDAISNIYRDTSYYAAIIKNNQASDLSANLKYNTEKNVITSLTTGYIKDEVKNLLDSDYIGINKRIEYINNDILYLFPRLLQKYNEDKFGNRSRIIKNILFKLYEKLYTNSNVDEYGVLYIPLDYTFNYVANRNNELEIYYSNDIFVNLINLDELTQLKRNDSLVDNVMYSYKGENKSKVFSFSLEYNSMYDGIINNIFVSYKYTLPFINGANNWSVNDIDTNISATVAGVDKQNLVILHCSYNKDDAKVTYKLLNVFDESLFNTAGWINKTTSYNNEIRLRYCVPKINSTNLNSLMGCTILLICDSSCVISNYNDIDQSTSYSLFLTIAKDDYNEFSFVPVELDNGNLLNLSSVINTSELIETVTNKIQLSSRLFNAVIINNRSKRLNQTSTNAINNALMFTVNTSEDVVKAINSVIKKTTGSDSVSINDSRYRNNLNVSLGFISNQTTNILDYVIDNANREYFLKLNDSVSVTNAAYQWISNLEEKVIKETIKVVDLDNTVIRFETVTIKKVVRDNIYNMYDSHGSFIQRLTETDYLKVINKDYSLTEVELSSRTVKDVAGNQEISVTATQEFLFDSDIPLLNLKEMFVANVNALNRVNILSLSESGEIYNGYIGSDFTSGTKTEMLITSTDTNINVGNNTLISCKDAQNFKKYKSLKLKFDDAIIIDAKKISATSQIFSGATVAGVSIYSANVTPIGSYVQTNVSSVAGNVLSFYTPKRFKYMHPSITTDFADKSIVMLYDLADYNIFKKEFIQSCYDNDTFIYYPKSGRNTEEWNTVGDYGNVILPDYKVIIINWINLLKSYGIVANDYVITVNEDVISGDIDNISVLNSEAFNDAFANKNCIHLTQLIKNGSTEVTRHVALSGIYSTDSNKSFKEMSIISTDANAICVMKNIFILYYMDGNTCNVDITIPNDMLAKLSAVKIN